MWADIVFAYPGFLWLEILLAPAIAWYIWKNRTLSPSLNISTHEGFAQARITWRNVLRHVPFSFRIIALGLMILALARPQSTNRWQNVSTEGIDIMLSLDISGSMLAEDFRPNRLEASKDVASEFINGRPNDRIGLVVFSGRSFTQCPLTTDHNVLINLFGGIKFGLIQDGTAIGEGLATSVNRLKDSDAKSKVIILLTDGVNNAGAVAPITAAEIAKTFGIRVYTIGVGSMGMAPYPVQTPFGIQYQDMEVEIDEALLTQMADMTGGKYFRATDNKKLREIYQEIDKMEKTITAFKEYRKRKEEFFPVLLIAALVFGAELMVRFLLNRNLP